MKKIKKIILALILSLCFITPAFAGCSFFSEDDEPTDKLQARTLQVFEDSKCLTWDFVDSTEDNDYEDDYAGSFEIYCNDKLLDTVDASTHIYEFESILTEVKNYNFYVIAKSSKKSIKDSDASNIVTYNNTSIINRLGNVKNVNINSSQITATISSNIITINTTNAPNGISNYLLYLKSNSTGLNVYTIALPNGNPTTFTVVLDASKYNILNEIYTIRIGYTLSGVNCISSDIIYYNPDFYSGFTDNIFTFDGYTYDFYVNTFAELKTLIYYSFIHRMEDFNIKLSDEVVAIAETFDGDNFAQELDNILYHECFGNIFETMCYSANNRVGNSMYFSRVISAPARTYNIKVTYNSIYECDTNFEIDTNYILPQVESECYWEQAGYTSRAEKYGSSYDNFASDKQFEYAVCKTSEELYWAVENKVVPKFTSTSSRAYKIYNQAKNILNEIISDDMSDYEKALCVFDWICYNTQYDYYSITYSNDDIMRDPCFYLEGVFMTGYAVCDGFSKAYSLMCNMLGIDAIRIVGYAVNNGSRGGHAWNKVLLDKNPTDNIPAQYYIVDITWTELSAVENTEELAHTYFLLSDEDVSSSHIEFPGRTKYNNYIAPENYYHFTEQKFTYNNVTYDMAITSVDEISPLFEYMLANDLNNLEIAIDLNLMITEYMKANGGYDFAHDIKYNAATGATIYYYELRNFFNQTILKNNKFASQYIFINYSPTTFIYNAKGDRAIIYTLQQNLLIDENSEIAGLVDFFNTHQVNGEFTLYIKNEIFGDSIGNYLTHAQELFASSLASTNVELEFTILKTHYVYDTGKQAAVYTLKVSTK